MNNKLPIYITINEPKKAFYTLSVSEVPTLLTTDILVLINCLNLYFQILAKFTILNNLFNSKLDLQSFPDFGNT